MSDTDTPLPSMDDDAGPQAPSDAFAILVATDGRLVRLNPANGGLALAIDGRKLVTLDRFQAAAFRQAMAALPAEG